MKIQLKCVLILIFLFLVCSPVFAQTDEECLACHGQKDLTVTDESGKEISLFVNYPLLQGSVHGGFNCATCHSGVLAEPHESKPEKVDCGTCHNTAAQLYFSGVHGKRHVQEFELAPGCIECHGSHNVKAIDDPESQAYRGNLPQLCGGCHGKVALVSGLREDDLGPADLYKRSVHGKLLEEGMVDILVCSDCHSSHRTKSSFDSESASYKTKIPQLCSNCHPDAYEEYKEDVHGKAIEAGVLSAPVCTDCHGAHSIQSSKEVTSLTYPPNITRVTCSRCHSEERVGARYAVATERKTPYTDLYHGVVSRAGDPDAASCADCHGNHNIFSASHPKSTTHKDNLPQTCGKCHSNAGENFVKGSLHLEPRTKKDIWVWMIRRIYLVLIPLIIGGMLLHNFVIMLKYVMQRYKESAADNIIRFTKNEVIQHLILFMSFTVLAYTGLALRFPDWWIFSWLTHSESGMAFRGLVHRIAAVVFMALCLYNLFYLFFNKRGKQQLIKIFPLPEDTMLLIKNINYHLGLVRERPDFDHYDYAEKAEFWALVWGAVVMIITGFPLWFEDFFLKFMPIWLLDVFKSIHFYEAVLATSAIIVWHFFSVFFHPDIYPINFGMLTGRISEEDVMEKHSEEFRQLKMQERSLEEEEKEEE
jgi:cytochrome b subunit of formate dehydrogenase